MAESIYNDVSSPDKFKMRLNLSTQNGAFPPMSGIGLSGGTTYTFNSQANSENSPKRFKSLGNSKNFFVHSTFFMCTCLGKN